MNDRNSITKDIDKAIRLLVSIRKRIIKSEQAGGMKAGGRRRGSKESSTALGRNIKRLKLELGWTYNDLERLSGIDKKRILDHVNKGVMPHPHILKDYSDTFTKALGRPISIADLLAEM